MVGPCEMLTRRLFSASAIAVALALFGVFALALPEVRRLVSPWATVGSTSARTWLSVRRWVAAVREGRLLPVVRRPPAGWSTRQVAERAATTVAAYAPLGPGPPDMLADVFHGAARAG